VTVAALSRAEPAEFLCTATGRSPRFSVVQIKHGPCLVLDLACHRKTVASSFDLDAAEALARLMNGDIQNAIASRNAAIASLGPPRTHGAARRSKLQPF